MKPLISIIIPTYNRAHLIGETLDSIVTQTYTNWECIIVDDGSTDNSSEIIEDFIKKDSRFQYHNRPKNRLKGANACRNYGFKLSKGDYIKWFDSDDIMYPDFLEKQVAVLQKDNELSFCACQSLTFYEGKKNVIKNEVNRIPTHSLILSYLVKNHYFFTGSPLWKKIFLHKKDLFDESLTDSHESDFHLRMLLYFPKYIYTADFFFSIRRGNNSITQNKLNKKSSLESKINFFIKAKKLIYNQKIDDKKLIIEYLTFRISGSIYELCQFNPRFGVLLLHKKNVLSLIFQKNIQFKNRIKLIIGFILLFIFGKGYKLLKENLNIREEIIS